MIYTRFTYFFTENDPESPHLSKWGMNSSTLLKKSVDNIRSLVLIIYMEDKEKYIHESHSVHHILYHMVFCPKRRRKVLVDPVHDRLKEIVEQVAEENNWHIERLATCIRFQQTLYD